MASMASLEGGRRTELGCGMAGAKKLHGFHSFTVLLQPTAFSAATYRSPGSCANATSRRSAGSPPCHMRTGIRPQRTRAARRVPRREAAADEARVEAPLDERLRHVAPNVEAVCAVHGHWLVRPQLSDP